MELIQTETILLTSASVSIPLIFAGLLQLAGKTGMAKKALWTSAAFALVCTCFLLLDVIIGMERAKALLLGSLFAVIVGACLGRILRRIS